MSPADPSNKKPGSGATSGRSGGGGAKKGGTAKKASTQETAAQKAAARQAPRAGEGGNARRGAAATATKTTAREGGTGRAPASRASQPPPSPSAASRQRTPAADGGRSSVGAENRDAWAEAAKANTRRALGLTMLPAGTIAVLFVVLGILGLVPLVLGIVIAALALATAGSALVLSPRALLARIDTIPADPATHARLYNVVEGLCLAWGLPQPELRLLVDEAPNAITIGRSSDDAVIICTTGLLHLLDRMELEAVLGHELAHVRNLDILSGSVAAGTIGYVALLNSGARSSLVRRSGAGRESHADHSSVALTRYPPAMISALDKLAAAPTRSPAGISHSLAVRTAHLWLVPLDAGTPGTPGTPGAPGTSDASAAPPAAAPIPGALTLDERIELLRHL